MTISYNMYHNGQKFWRDTSKIWKENKQTNVLGSHGTTFGHLIVKLYGIVMMFSATSSVFKICYCLLSNKGNNFTYQYLANLTLQQIVFMSHSGLIWL